jgi:general stress protein 26
MHKRHRESTTIYVMAEVILEIPFDKKDEAKALGAKWDMELKTWYSFANHPNIAALRRLQVRKVYFSFAYDKDTIEAIKALGARYSSECRKWWAYDNNPHIDDILCYSE